VWRCWCRTVGQGETKFRYSVKKEARLSARALAEVEVGRGEEDLRCKSLFIVCQRRRGSSEDEETIGVMVYGCKNQIMVAVTKRFESGPITSIVPFSRAKLIKFARLLRRRRRTTCRFVQRRHWMSGPM